MNVARNTACFCFSENTNEKKFKVDAVSDNKKMLTKGAMKIFEGLKVSIPTQDLDLSSVLHSKLFAKNLNSVCVDQQSKNTVCEKISVINLEPEKKMKEYTAPMESKIKECKKKLTKISRKFKGKNTKKSANQKEIAFKGACKNNDIKTYDVYDFEETQDNSDVFKINSLSQYRTFKNQAETDSSLEKNTETQVKEQRNVANKETNSLETSMSSASSFSNISCKQTKGDKIITKKKCVIMGRIFKNALKSKCDDTIREIPTVDNNQLITDYVLNCDSPVEKTKPKMSQEELDQLFNKLLSETNPSLNNNPSTNCALKSKVHICKESTLKQRPTKCAKSKKRLRNNSESTDDEFSISKQCRKRTGKKNIKETDNSINLEQELRECIGVASRKSQRKCTSGKQNILVEFWSSDESVSEAVLEIKPIQNSTIDKKVENKAIEQNEMITCTVNTKSEINNGLINTNDSNKKCVTQKPLKKHKKSLPKIHTEPVSVSGDKSKTSESTTGSLATSRCKRSSANTLYYWSSSSDDELQDMVEVKPIRDEFDDEERPMQHGWIVGDSPKKLVTMLAQAKGKKVDVDCVKEQVKSRTSASHS